MRVSVGQRVFADGREAVITHVVGAEQVMVRELAQTNRTAPNCGRAVKKLKPPLAGFRLRCGDYRVFFELKDASSIAITGVKNRREAYR